MAPSFRQAGSFVQGVALLVAIVTGPAFLVASAESGPAQQRPRRASRGPISYEQTLDAAMRMRPDMNLWSNVRRTAYQRSLREPVGEPIAVLEMPRIGIRVAVLSRDDDPSLDRAVSHVAGTPQPGESGNVGIAGHRDSYFRTLERMRRGDELRLVTPEGVREYRVAETSIVDPSDTRVLAPTSRDAVTLVTCYPFYYVGHAPRRYILRAYAAGPAAERASQRRAR